MSNDSNTFDVLTYETVQGYTIGVRRNGEGEVKKTIVLIH